MSPSTSVKPGASRPAVLDDLARHGTLSPDGTRLHLTPDLPDETYRPLADAVSWLGGRWVRSEAAHVFPADVRPTLERVLRTGKFPALNPTAFFPTPASLVDTIVELAGLTEFSRVLEPSAGTGAIADAARSAGARVEVCELLPSNRAVLEANGHQLVADDFLAFEPGEPYTHVLMNPPFAVQGDPLAYVTHIEHAWRHLTPNGVLIAVVPTGFEHDPRPRLRQFSDFVLTYGEVIANPAGSFRQVGTNVGTCTLSLQRGPDWRRAPYEGWPSWSAWYAHVLLRNDAALSAAYDQALASGESPAALKDLTERLERSARTEWNCALRLDGADLEALWAMLHEEQEELTRALAERNGRSLQATAEPMVKVATRPARTEPEPTGPTPVQSTGRTQVRPEPLSTGTGRHASIQGTLF